MGDPIRLALHKIAVRLRVESFGFHYGWVSSLFPLNVRYLTSDGSA